MQLQEHDIANGAYSFEFKAQSSETRFRLVRRDEDGSGKQNTYLDHTALYNVRDTSYHDTTFLTTGNGYRYSFQGQLKDDELLGVGNAYAFKYRIHDVRTGRFYSVDPLTAKYPDYSPYSFSGNKLICAAELVGLEEVIVIRNHKKDGEIEIQRYNSLNTENFENIRQSFWHYTIADENKNERTTGKGDCTLGTDKSKSNWDGKSYGKLTIDTYQDGSDSKISYDNVNYGIDKARRQMVEGKRMEGMSDIFIGSIKVAGAIASEVGSAGLATAVAYAEFIQGADQIVGGFRKGIDPKEFVSGNEVKPIKFLIGKYSDESGETLYDYIDIATGVRGMAQPKGEMVEIVGAVTNSAAASKEIKKHTSNSNSNSNSEKK